MAKFTVTNGLNCSTVLHARVLLGSPFHNLGPATLKILFANVSFFLHIVQLSSNDLIPSKVHIVSCLSPEDF